MTSEDFAWEESKNAMEKAYQNPNFNRYDDGPGADLPDDLQPGAIAADPKVEKSLDVYLGNLSMDLTEQGIRNLVSKYGPILKVIRTPNTKWSIVKFDSVRYMLCDVYSSKSS